MMKSHKYAKDVLLTEALNKITKLIQIGIISEVDYKKARVRVTIGDLTTAFLPWLTNRASNDINWWAPEKDEQVIVFSPNGEMNLGVVLPGIYQEKHPAPANKETIEKKVFKDGTTFEYDREKHKHTASYSNGIKVEVDAKSSAVSLDMPAGHLTVTAPDGITFKTPKLKVTGDIKAGGDVSDSTRSMAADRKIYNLHLHPPWAAVPPIPKQ